MVQIDPFGAYAQGANLQRGINQQRAQVQAATGLASGNYAQALGALGGVGDVGGVVQVQNAQVANQERQLEQQKRQQAQQLQTTMQIIGTVKRARDSGQDVSQILPTYRDAFIAMGTDPQQLAQIEQQVAANPAFLDQIEQIVGQQARELEILNLGGGSWAAVDQATGQRVSGYNAPREVGGVVYNPETFQPVLDTRKPEYIQRDPTKDLVQITPGGGAQPPADGGRQPRGIRNNNPGNIEDGAFAKSLPGYAGSDGRFARFNTMQDGVAAGGRLLDSYASRGVVTPAQIINRWAPPSDNNPTQAYAQYVADRLGIGINDPVPANRREEAFQAINEFENGNRGPSQGSGPRVVAAATPQQAGGTLLSAQEVAAAGLAPGTVAQRSTTGQISILQAGPQAANRNRPTEAQNKDSFNANRMSRAGQIINNLEQNNYDWGRAQIGGQLTENFRKYDAAAEEWTDAILRLTTGAAATADEIASNRRAYFPVVGDSPAVREQKRRQRAAVERDALLRGQGGASSEGQGSTQNRQRPQTNAPGIPFNLAGPQLATRQRLVQQGATSRAAVGSTQNPRYVNPQQERQSLMNIRPGEWFVTPSGETLRMPNPNPYRRR